VIYQAQAIATQQQCIGKATAANTGKTGDLLAAAERIVQTDDLSQQLTSDTLRPEQRSVVANFENYLLDIVTRPSPASEAYFARIVLPPRTGKTVVAAHLIALTRLHAVFVVPTRNLVHQVAEELQAQIPMVPIGKFYGENKETVQRGVNVATYSILQRCHQLRSVLEKTKNATLVIADEAHHAMTEDRMALFREGFSENTIRIALTATPDYNSTRRLAHHFPVCISHLSLYEAFQRDLLSPFRMWVAEVDADASKIRLIAGEYDSELLGEVMSSAPFFRAVEVFRYQTENRNAPALISCVSRRQAYLLKSYLDRHRPVGASAPALILGETPDSARIDLLNQFERGEIDTIIQVGVLIEGWNSPRCKLLIDLAPSRSRVRATQKFFRVMTRHYGQEARIYIIVPDGLQEAPLLPTDLFGNPFNEYMCGELFDSESNSAGLAPAIRSTPTPIEGVTLKKRIRDFRRFIKPTVDKKNLNHLRLVLESAHQFDRFAPPGFQRFQKINFEHPLFAGSGGLLLDHCGIQNRSSYNDWLTTLYPETMANILYLEKSYRCDQFSNEGDLLQLLQQGTPPPEQRWTGWLALGGRLEPQWDTPENFLISCETYNRLWQIIDKLRPRERSIFIKRFGLDGLGKWTLMDIAEHFNRSPERIRQISARAFRKVKRYWYQQENAVENAWQ
jgi:RNA polymerase sigma factor (sigma-70 family)